MILNDRQIKLLELLDKKVQSCERCSLYENGRANPLWTEHSKYAIIGEAPGRHEVEEGVPFVGAAGKVLTDVLSSLGFKARDFLIVNSVNCRAVDFHNPFKNGKPSLMQLECCSDWLRKYLKIVDPEKILCLGNYAKHFFDQSVTGILGIRGRFIDMQIDETTRAYPVMYTIHPAYALYNQDEGEDMLRQDLTLFRNKQVEVKKNNQWLLSEDDFKL